MGRRLAHGLSPARLARRLWPAAIVVPLLIGTASWMGYSAGLFSEWAAITVMNRALA